MSFPRPSHSYLLFDDDCGICTKFSKLLRRILPSSVAILPMHNPLVLSEGVEALGYEEYWTSFHMVVDQQWSTEAEAIIQLAGTLPLGSIWKLVASTPIILKPLLQLLRLMQKIRHTECAIN